MDLCHGNPRCRDTPFQMIFRLHTTWLKIFLVVMETGVILLILAALLAFNCCAFRGALHMVNLHDSYPDNCYPIIVLSS